MAAVVCGSVAMCVVLMVLVFVLSIAQFGQALLFDLRWWRKQNAPHALPGQPAKCGRMPMCHFLFTFLRRSGDGARGGGHNLYKLVLRPGAAVTRRGAGSLR